MYDYLIVGAGLFGAIIACEANKKGKKVLVIDKRSHIAGNIYTEKLNNIDVHKYGAHIFHTNNKKVWDYINKYGEFNRFTNSPIAIYDNEVYSLPFNMYTFNKIWNITKPEEAIKIIEKDKEKNKIENPSNLQEQAISLVGEEIYEKLIKGYTEKQWGRKCIELPPAIIKRLPVRFTYDNNYFNADFQGIPINGYTELIGKMLEGVEVRTGVDYILEREVYSKIAKNVIYTGQIDEYYEYKFGELDYRKVEFETEILEMDNYQGNAVVNYTDLTVPYTRIIEHKWFNFKKQEGTIISKEYSKEWRKGEEPYYPVNDKKNSELYMRYKEEAKKETNIVFGGRLGEYKYYDMDITIEQALKLVEKLFGENYL